MVGLSVQQKASVEAALSECEELGTTEFFKIYDCGWPKKFWIKEKGTKLPAKAILYVAHRLEHSQDQRKVWRV
jgi:hypothetical protein